MMSRITIVKPTVVWNAAVRGGRSYSILPNVNPLFTIIKGVFTMPAKYVWKKASELGEITIDEHEASIKYRLRTERYPVFKKLFTKDNGVTVRDYGDGSVTHHIPMVGVSADKVFKFVDKNSLYILTSLCDDHAYVGTLSHKYTIYLPSTGYDLKDITFIHESSIGLLTVKIPHLVTSSSTLSDDSDIN